MAAEGPARGAVGRYVAELKADGLSEMALEYVIAQAGGSNRGP